MNSIEHFVVVKTKSTPSSESDVFVIIVQSLIKSCLIGLTIKY